MENVNIVHMQNKAILKTRKEGSSAKQACRRGSDHDISIWLHKL